MSDPRHFDTISLFSNRVMSVIKIDLTVDDIQKMPAASVSNISVLTTTVVEFVWTGLFPSDPVIRFGGECTTSGGARSNMRLRNLQTGRTELQIWWKTYFVRTALLSNSKKAFKRSTIWSAVIKYIESPHRWEGYWHITNMFYPCHVHFFK